MKWLPLAMDWALFCGSPGLAKSCMSVIMWADRSDSFQGDSTVEMNQSSRDESIDDA